MFLSLDVKVWLNASVNQPSTQPSHSVNTTSPWRHGQVVTWCLPSPRACSAMSERGQGEHDDTVRRPQSQWTMGTGPPQEAQVSRLTSLLGDVTRRYSGSPTLIYIHNTCIHTSPHHPFKRSFSCFCRRFYDVCLVKSPQMDLDGMWRNNQADVWSGYLACKIKSTELVL